MKNTTLKIVKSFQEFKRDSSEEKEKYVTMIFFVATNVFVVEI